MPNLKSVAGTVILLSLLSLGSAQAAKPVGDSVKQTEHSESFWNRWFGRSEKAEQRDSAEDKAKDKAKDKQKNVKDERQSNRYFSDLERSRIADYYRQDSGSKHDNKGKKNKQKKLPSGLQKKLARGGQLPPGWQDKVARGEVLDGDILRHSELIPDELARRLPALRDGEEIRRVGNKVVRVMEGNGTVIDVIDLADTILR